MHTEPEVPQIHIVDENEVISAKQREDYSELLAEFGLNEDYTKASWLCFGGGARNFVHLLLDTIDPEERPYARILGANTDVQQFVDLLKPSGDDKPRFLKKWRTRVKDYGFRLLPLGKEGGAGRDPEVAKKNVLEKLDEVEKSISDSKSVILVSNLGGGTGSGTAPVIAELLGKKEDIGSVAILMTPYGYEGEGSFNRAETAYHEVTKHIAAITLRNQAIYEAVTDPRYKKLAKELEGVSTVEAISITNKYALLPVIEALDQLIMYAGKSVNRDPRDFRKVVRSGKDVHVGIYHSNQEGAAETKEEIVEQLLNNPFLASDIVERSTLGMILYCGFSHEDAGYIGEAITSAMKNSDGQKPVELIPGHDNAGKDGQRSIFLMTVAEEVRDFKRLKATQKSGFRVQRSTPANPAQTINEEPDRLSPVKVGIKGPQRKVIVTTKHLPEDLAKKIQEFPEKYRGAFDTQRKEVWESLRKEARAHLDNVEMAELHPFRFINENGMNVHFSITPILMERYRALEKRCREAKPGDKEAAMQEFEDLSSEWKKETGHELNLKSSFIFDNAFRSPDNKKGGKKN